MPGPWEKYGAAKPWEKYGGTPTIPGMEKLGQLPPAGQPPDLAMHAAVNPESRATGLDVPALRSMNETLPLIPLVGSVAALTSGAAGLATHPIGTVTSIGTGLAAHKGAKMLGLPEPIPTVASLAGGIAGGLGASRIANMLRDMPSDVAASLPTGKFLKWYVSRGLPEPRPSVPPPPFMKQKVVIEKPVPSAPTGNEIPSAILPQLPKSAPRVAPMRSTPAVETPAEPAAIPAPPAATSTVESPIPATAGTFKHSAAHTDLMRQIHAVGKELELPGSPAGKDAHAIISETAKKLYGVKSLSELSYEQLQNLNEHLLKHKALPTIPPPPK